MNKILKILYCICFSIFNEYFRLYDTSNSWFPGDNE